MPEEKNELADFLKELPDQDQTAADLFKEQPAVEEPKAEEEKTPEEGEGKKNRRHRRWEERLSEREKDLIAREARAQALSEVQKFSQDTEVDERLIRMYGNTDEGKEAARLHQELLADYTAKGKEEALHEIEERQAQAVRKQKEYESAIDSELEALEDEHNVDLTSNSPAARKARKEFLEMVHTLSPKNEDGEVTSYADFGATYDLYQSTREKADTTRQKELGSRSMEKSGPVNSTKVEDDQQLAWLRSQGIQV